MSRRCRHMPKAVGVRSLRTARSRGTRTAIRFPRYVMTTSWPLRTLLSSAAVLCLRSLAVAVRMLSLPVECVLQSVHWPCAAAEGEIVHRVPAWRAHSWWLVALTFAVTPAAEAQAPIRIGATVVQAGDSAFDG